MNSMFLKRDRLGKSLASILATVALLLVSARPGHALRILITAPLTVADVQSIIARAVTQAVNNNQKVTIAVSDREGNILGVFIMNGAPANAANPDLINRLRPGGSAASVTAMEKAQGAAFLSSDQNAFSTRTGGFIIQKHFPPNVAKQSQGPLFGLQFSQLPCSDVTRGNGVTGAPGGIPLYKKKKIAGGIGVEVRPPPPKRDHSGRAASGPYSVPRSITADKILLNGIRLLWIQQPLLITSRRYLSAACPAVLIRLFRLGDSQLTFNRKNWRAVGEIRFPIIDSPMPGPTKLLASDVTTIMNNSIRRAQLARAAIRLPIGTRRGCR